MLVELHVRDLGVIDDATMALGPGMTALTGETGAGKTLLVEALELLLGGRADPVLVRPGAPEAMVEGRFAVDGGARGNGHDDGEDELILARAVPAAGRSRAWVDGRMAPIGSLTEAGARLVDLHGQHAQQSLLDPQAQRRALDLFGRVDLSRLAELHATRRRLVAELGALGGDERARAREVDLLRYQLDEIDAAAVSGPDEDDELAAEEDRLADAAAHREAASTALGALDAEPGEGASVIDLLGTAAAAVEGRGALAPFAERMAALQAESADLASALRGVVEEWEDDPGRLDEVRGRRQLLRDLSRKYGEGPAGVLAYASTTRERLAELESVEERATAVQEALRALDVALAEESAVVGAARRRAGPALSKAVEARLRALAMPKARLEVQVGEEDPGEEVTFLLGANPGEPVLPLAKVASGGELARAMLALRLELSDAPPTMVFDEVDAGIGGEAAVSVGRALAELATRHQVLVVTHLAQVAAFATRQLVVRKDVAGGRTRASVTPVDGAERVVELARMLSGRPDSATARRHAEELLVTAGVDADR